MGEHDYAVLAVVALVGFAAVVSMASSVYVPSDNSERPMNLFTGSATAHVPSSSSSVSGPDFDFSGDGQFTLKDSDILAQAILDNRCPSRKTCDVNGDGLLDMRDLEVFNSMVSYPAKSTSTVVVSHSKPSIIEPHVGSRLA